MYPLQVSFVDWKPVSVESPAHSANSAARAPARLPLEVRGGVVALALVSCLGAAHGANSVSIGASSHGTAVEINASATLKASHGLIWQTLTDYDHLSEFIPGIKTSHVIERRGSAAIVRQTGQASVMFFAYPIEVVVESLEKPPNAIGIRVLRGNLKQLDGGYRLEQVGDKDAEYILRWSGIIEPSISLPGFITVPLMRANISAQFQGMVKEIERRAALQRKL